MTVIELLEALSDLPEDAEIMLASQPAWPFEYTLGEPVVVGTTTVHRPCTFPRASRRATCPARPHARLVAVTVGK